MRKKTASGIVLLGLIFGLLIGSSPAQAWTKTVSLAGSLPSTYGIVYQAKRVHETGTAKMESLAMPAGALCYPFETAMRSGPYGSSGYRGSFLANSGGTHWYNGGASVQGGNFYMSAKTYLAGCNSGGGSWTGKLFY